MKNKKTTRLNSASDVQNSTDAFDKKFAEMYRSEMEKNTLNDSRRLKLIHELKQSQNNTVEDKVLKQDFRSRRGRMRTAWVAACTMFVITGLIYVSGGFHSLQLNDTAQKDGGIEGTDSEDQVEMAGNATDVDDAPHDGPADPETDVDGADANISNGATDETEAETTTEETLTLPYQLLSGSDVISLSYQAAPDGDSSQIELLVGKATFDTTEPVQGESEASSSILLFDVWSIEVADKGGWRTLTDSHGSSEFNLSDFLSANPATAQSGDNEEDSETGGQAATPESADEHSETATQSTDTLQLNLRFDSPLYADERYRLVLQTDSGPQYFELTVNNGE